MPIGETLAQARHARGLTVDDVAHATMIRGTVIRAIEAEEFDICRGAVYARGHIRSIARVVGVDPDPLIEEFDEHHGGPPGGPVALVPPQFDPKAERVTRPRRANWLLAATVSLLVIIGFAVAALVAGGHPGTAARTAVRAPAPSPKASPSARPAAPPPPSAVALAGVTVLAKVTAADSWFSVKNSSGATVFQGLVYAGQRKEFTDPRQLSFVIGNAPVVDLVVNGHNIGAPTGQGNVARVSFGPGNPTATAAAG